MSTTQTLGLAAVLAGVVLTACAQAPAQGTGPANAASAPGPGARMGPGGMGPGGMGAGGMGMRGRGMAGQDYTPGWGMMSSAERDEHRQRMASLQSYEECKAYMDKHHEQMVARAKEQGRTMPEQPRRDACEGFKR